MIVIKPLGNIFVTLWAGFLMVPFWILDLTSKLMILAARGIGRLADNIRDHAVALIDVQLKK